jgi:hypothetical protein
MPETRINQATKIKELAWRNCLTELCCMCCRLLTPPLCKADLAAAARGTHLTHRRTALQAEDRAGRPRSGEGSMVRMVLHVKSGAPARDHVAQPSRLLKRDALPVRGYS